MVYWTFVFVMVMVINRTCTICSTVKFEHDDTTDMMSTESSIPSSDSHYHKTYLTKKKESLKAMQSMTIPLSSSADPSVEEIGKTSLDIDAHRKCKTSNGTVDVYSCVNYLQSQILKMVSTEPLFERRLGRFLTELSISFCLNNLEIVNYNPREQLCCNGVLNKTGYYERCCDGDIIDIRKQLCCHDNIFEKGKHNACCGTFVYDEREHFCCGNKLHNISQDQGCCGANIFNRKDQICCHDIILESFHNGNNTGECCNSTNTVGFCYSCENGRQLMTRFDESTEMCCNGKITKKIHSNESECCSDLVMDVRKQICKNGKIFQKDGAETKINSSVKSSNRLSLASEKKNGLNDKDVFVDIVIFASVIPFGVFLIWVLKRSKKMKIRLFKQHLYKCLGCNTTGVSSNDSIPVGEAKPCSQQEHVHLIKETFDESCSNTCTCNTNLLYNDHEHLNFKSSTSFSDLTKTVDIPKWNLEEEHFAEADTQTVSEQLVQKRTIFGKPFDYTFMLDETNATLQMPDSDVQMTLPSSSTKNEKVEVSSSTFRNVNEINEKLDLADNEKIASPVVEYYVKGTSKLDEHACIIIPFVGKCTDLSVMKFDSDEGISAAAKSTLIPRKDRQNVSVDCYYIVDGPTVKIYTKSFSGFYCKTCKHKRELELVAYVFGSYKRLNEQYEVFITVYIVDELFKFDDYGQAMRRSEEVDQKRTFLRRDVRLEMPDCDLNEQDYVEVSLRVKSEGAKWMHVIINPDTRELAYEETKNIKLSRIAKKCTQCPSLHTRQDAHPEYKQWYLCNRENTVPSDKFQCFVNLNVCKEDSEIRKGTCITIDELELRKEGYAKRDVMPIQETSYRSDEGAAGPRTKTLYTRTGTGGAVGVLSNAERPSQPTYVRAENKSRITTRAHTPPNPELSQENETLGPAALQYVGSHSQGND